MEFRLTTWSQAGVQNGVGNKHVESRGEEPPSALLKLLILTLMQDANANIML